MKQVRVCIKRNDQMPPLYAKLLTQDNKPVNLTGCTVKFLMGPDFKTLALSGLCEIIDAAEGEVEYHWNGTDTLNAGLYLGEFEVTYPSGRLLTVPNDGYLTIEILPDLG